MIGNMGHLWFQWLLGKTKCYEKIILDDGLATINTIKNLTNGIKQKKEGRLSFVERKMLNNKSIELNKLVFFSRYDKLNFAPAMFIQNELKYLKSKYAKLHYKKTPNAIFIGQLLSENGILSFESYIYMINSIKEYYESKGIEFIYMCHRRDEISRLPHDWNIQKIDVPIEIHILSQDFIPATILSFYSTALLNLKILLPEISQIISVRISDSLINANFLEDIRNIYNYFEQEKSSNFSIVDFYAIEGRRLNNDK